MNQANNEIHPVFHEILQREDKERLLNQRSKVIWLTGLSGSGKTTLVAKIMLELCEEQEELIPVYQLSNPKKS